jgi:phenylpyruvate tautomerase PptA (4-oxalocrotonate tautomerase family)
MWTAIGADVVVVEWRVVNPEWCHVIVVEVDCEEWVWNVWDVVDECMAAAPE